MPKQQFDLQLNDRFSGTVWWRCLSPEHRIASSYRTDRERRQPQRLSHSRIASESIDKLAIGFHGVSLQNADQKIKHQEPDLQIIFLQTAEMERNDRLKIARQRMFKTAKEAAASFGVPYGTYSGHESGSRGIKDEELAHYARRLHVPLEWLAYGIPSETVPKISICGHIGMNEVADAVNFILAGELQKDAPLPALYTNTTSALEVVGSSMRQPSRGWLVYYDQARMFYPPLDDLFGLMSICWLDDGRILMKEIYAGRQPLLYDLDSVNIRLIRDVAIIKASPVTSMIPSADAQFRLRQRAPQKVA